MSLINDMLKDLEERGGAGRAGGVRATPATRSSRATRSVLIALAALVVLLGGTLAWLLRPASPVSAAVRPVVVAAQEAPPPAPAETDVRESLPAPMDDVAKVESSTAESQAPANPVMDDAATAAAATETAPAPEPVVAEAASRMEEEEEERTNSVIVRRHEPTAAEKAARAGRDGFAALRLGDWASASRLLGELVALEPANDEAREGLAVALANQGRIAESESVLLDGIAVGAAPARFAKLRARLQAARGELDAALDSLSVAVPAPASDSEFHALKAALAQQAGRHETAAEIYRALTALDPANATWQAGLGMALDALGDFADAHAAYERAFSAGGLDPALLAHIESRLAALKPD